MRTDQGVTLVGSWGNAIFLTLTGALHHTLGFLSRPVGALVILLLGRVDRPRHHS